MTTKIASILFCLFVFTACSSNSDTNIYEGKKIEIDYRYVESIDDQSWIKIDTIQFRHLRDRMVAENSEFVLPTNEIIIDSLDTGKTLRTRANSASIPMYLSRSFILINSSLKEDSTAQKGYIVNSPSIASVMGKFVILNKDSSDITVEAPKDYPAKITVIDN